MEIEDTNDDREPAGDNVAETLRESTPRYMINLVIPNKRRDCVVGEVLANGVLRLPRMELPDSIEYPCFDREDEMETCIESQLGIRGYIVRTLWSGHSDNTWIEGAGGAEEHEILLFDIVDDQAALRKPLTWIRRDVACSNNWMRRSGDGDYDDVRGVLKYVFRAINGECKGEEKFEGWERLGWFEKVRSWTHDVLEGRNMVMEGRIRQRQRGMISCVMSCEVKLARNGEREGRKDCDVIYIKASVPPVREAQRTVTIRKVIGNIVPEVIGIDDTGDMMIQRSVGKVTDDEWDQEGLIKTMLRMQTLSMNRISELEAGGLRIADSVWMESNMERILNHELLDEYNLRLADKGPGDLKESMVNKLRSMVNEIKEKCRKITSLGLPRTIVHADLLLENIGSRLKEEGNMYRFFDWVDSFIGNPLHDFRDAFVHIDEDLCWIDYEAGAKQVYEYWKPCGTLEEMKAVFPLVNMLSRLVRVYDLTEQWDARDESQSGYGHRQVLRLLIAEMALLRGDMGEWL